MTCQSCATREAHIYDVDCPRCHARMLARTPSRLLREAGLWANLDEEQKRMVVEERERDIEGGVTA